VPQDRTLDHVVQSRDSPATTAKAFPNFSKEKQCISKEKQVFPNFSKLFQIFFPWPESRISRAYRQKRGDQRGFASFLRLGSVAPPPPRDVMPRFEPAVRHGCHDFVFSARIC
jgi:hypothetical protein